jgi:PPK2 family polyphosphate:nucleotide phosphotransferase
MDLAKQFRVTPGSDARLKHRKPDDTAGWDDKQAARQRTARNVETLAALQYRLYAESRRSVLIVVQAMDAGGKDGVVRHVLSGLNPAGCHVTSFKVPSSEELSHDYLWRIHRAAPPRGSIGVFNRSHYEDVLVVRVKNLAPAPVWQRRYRQINEFERTLTEEGTTVVKFFIHISKEEQRERLLSRLEDPERNWKFRAGDLDERQRWNEYQCAYEDALTRCSTRYAPWYVIPGDHKWFRDLAVSEILVTRLKEMKPRFPAPFEDIAEFKRRLRRAG